MPSFDIKAQHILCTWNEVPQDTDFPTAQGQFLDIRKDHDGDRKSFCLEEKNRRHCHGVFTTQIQIDCKASPGFDLYDKPVSDVQCNRARGHSFGTSVDRTHFYCQCKYKDGLIGSWTNYTAGVDFVVKTQWCLNLWQTLKITDDRIIPCMAYYKCCTPAAIAMVNATVSARRREEHQEDTERDIALRQLEKGFKDYDIIPVFKSYFDEHRHRYRFLVIVGPSLVGKSTFAANIFKNAFEHNSVMAWADYDHKKHDGIIFNDVHDIYGYICRTKALFQCNKIMTVQTSPTNAYAIEVNLIAKPIVITYEYPPTSPWILANADILDVDEKMYID